MAVEEILRSTCGGGVTKSKDTDTNAGNDEINNCKNALDNGANAMKISLELGSNKIKVNE